MMRSRVIVIAGILLGIICPIAVQGFTTSLSAVKSTGLKQVATRVSR